MGDSVLISGLSYTVQIVQAGSASVLVSSDVTEIIEVAPIYPGPQGTAGQAGSIILTGLVPPTSANGANGDYWFDSNSKYLYGPKAGGVWPSGTPLKGDQGEAALNADGGTPSTTYGGTSPLDGGTV